MGRSPDRDLHQNRRPSLSQSQQFILSIGPPPSTLAARKSRAHLREHLSVSAFCIPSLIRRESVHLPYHPTFSKAARLYSHRAKMLILRRRAAAQTANILLEPYTSKSSLWDVSEAIHPSIFVLPCFHTSRSMCYNNRLDVWVTASLMS